MAHGEFFLIGAYCVVVVERAGFAFWWALLLSPIVLAIIGVAVEELVVRHIYRRFIDSILATWGISLALKQTVIVIFGPTAQSIVSPIPGPVEILGVVYPAYRLFIMGVAVALTAATFLVFYRTTLGLAVRGVIANRAMAASLGINTRLLDRATFAIGAALAGIAGAVMAPIMSVDPQMGVGFLIPAFLSVLVGGTGTLLGALTGTAAIAGSTVVISDLWTDVTAQVVVFTLAIILIRAFPQGLTGRSS
jgi:urea transport system permease protein